MSVEDELKEAGYALPELSPSVGSYVGAVQTGSLVVTSGQLPFQDGQLTQTGKVGGDVSIEQAADAAVVCVLNALSQIKAKTGDLDKVTQVLRVDGYVNSADGFTQQPAVLNKASELLATIFGEPGRHSRIAVGVNELPLDTCVEVGVWVEISS